VVYAKSATISAEDLGEIIDEAAMGGSSLVSLGAGSSGAGGLLLWAIGLGVLTFFSPCSFPLLPGYMTYYLGLRDARNQRKAMWGGIAAASGIVFLFFIVAVLVGLFGSTISQYVLFLEPIVGILLISMAVLIFLDININFGLLTFPVKKGLALSRRMVGKFRSQWKVEGEDATDDALIKVVDEGGFVGLFFYGLGYGAASAGCMAPVVIALIVLAATQGTFLGAFAIFMVFALAMAILMVVITMTVGHYGGVLIDKLRVRPNTVKLVTSVLLLVVGVWVILYFVAGLA
jgi:cytochrome c-type biogenesis protein